MPLFEIKKEGMDRVPQTNFEREKVLQGLIESNLSVVFNSRFVASEFSTGTQHAGRIDTLALSEDNNPVIIEYKTIESSDLINQSLFYLSWIKDHKGDFEVAAQKKLGNSLEVDWSDVRVICIAPNFRKYDLHAVKVMGANIELWSYRLYKNSTLYLEEIFNKSYTAIADAGEGKDPKMVAAGKKAALTRASASYTFEEHIEGKPEKIVALAEAASDFILGLDPAMERAPKKCYVAFKISQNIACLEVQKSKILVFLKLDPKQNPGPEGISRDVSEIGHFGTGDLEVTLRSESDLEATKKYIELAYQNIGG